MISTTSNNTICAIIVTYNPDNNLFELISTISNQVNYIIIVDNNSSDQLIFKKLEFEKTYIIFNNQNFGIAKALNQGIKKAITLDCDWVITFDQDSKPKTNIVNKLLEIYLNCANNDDIGAIGTNFENQDKTRYKKVITENNFSECEYLITSGCLQPITNFSKFGFFREDYFIDNVDLEFSLRLRSKNKKLLISNESYMIHNAGNDPIRRNILGIQFIASNHNSFRRYFMSRNHILLCKQYFIKFPKFIIKTSFFYILSIFSILILEKNKFKKIFNSFSGLIDGIFNLNKYESRFRSN